MKDGLRSCSRQCMQKQKPCTEKECRLFIDYKEEYNCDLISIYENGAMTLREVGERLGISFARVKQIESAALLKMKKKKILAEVL